MNGIKGQQKGTADEKKKYGPWHCSCSMSQWSQKSFGGEFRIQKLWYFKIFYEIFDTTITVHKKMSESYLKLDTVKNSTEMIMTLLSCICNMTKLIVYRKENKWHKNLLCCLVFLFSLQDIWDEWYFVTKIVLTYCEKKLFWW